MRKTLMRSVPFALVSFLLYLCVLAPPAFPQQLDPLNFGLPGSTSSSQDMLLANNDDGKKEKPAATKEEEEKGERELPPEISIERTLIERGGLLLPPGQFEVEPALDYSYFDTRRISVTGFSILPSLIIGLIETERVERNVLEPSLGFRLGVVRDLQVEARVPFRYIHDRVSTETEERNIRDSEIGDIDGGIFYQPVRERGYIPNLILGVRGKSITGKDPFGIDPDKEAPTGTGFYSLTGIVTAVKSSDPAVIFASVLFTHNFERTVRILHTDATRTDIRPGFTVGYNLGIGLAISTDLAFSMRLEHRLSSHTDTRGEEDGARFRQVPGSSLNSATAVFGITWAVTKRTSMDISFGIGLTEDAPSAIVRVALPTRFFIY